MVELKEVKSLRWLVNMFPLKIPARCDEDKMCNCIHLYAEAAASKLEEISALVNFPLPCLDGMTLDLAVKQLEFDQDMILFNPTSGEELTLESVRLVNHENYRTYLADGIAIAAIKKIIELEKLCCGPKN